MPIYHVKMMASNITEQKKRLCAEITRASVEILSGAANSLDVIVNIKRDSWPASGKLYANPRN